VAPRSEELVSANRGQSPQCAFEHGSRDRRGQEKVAAKCTSSWPNGRNWTDALEDAGDYAVFEMAVTADHDAQSAVERELVLRLASLLWRLRRATTIESGLFNIHAKHLLQFRQRKQAHQKRLEIIDGLYRNALATEEVVQRDDDETSSSTLDPKPPSTEEPTNQAQDLTRSFVRLAKLPTYPLV